MPARVRRGDTVQVVAGKEKGKQGEVVRIEGERVVVRRVNMVKRHTKPTQQNPKGGIEEKEAAIHMSNVMPVDPKDGKPTRVGFRKEDDGRLVRVSVRTGNELPAATADAPPAAAAP